MPNLGAGVDQHVNPAVTPTWIFTPTPNAPATVQLYNEGQHTVFVGTSGLDTSGGLPIRPGSKPVRLQNILVPLYAISNVGVGAQSGTMTTTAVTAGSTVITLTGTVPTALAAGTTIVVGNTAGTGWEAQVVASTTASSQLTFTSALVNDHVGSSPVYLATPRLGQLRVTAGVV